MRATPCLPVLMPHTDVPPLPLRIKLRRTQCEQMSSDSPLKGDLSQSGRHFASGPIAAPASKQQDSDSTGDSLRGTTSPASLPYEAHRTVFRIGQGKMDPWRGEAIVVRKLSERTVPSADSGLAQRSPHRRAPACRKRRQGTGELGNSCGSSQLPYAASQLLGHRRQLEIELDQCHSNLGTKTDRVD
jgi:guanyl-specific ribonuclease Sa